MNVSRSIILASIGLLVTAICFDKSTTLAQQKVKVSFFCGRTNDGNLDPVTMMGVSSKKEHQPIVVWRNESGNMTPEQRCDKAFARFQSAWDRGDLQHITAGTDRSSGRGLICAVRNRDTSCDSSKMLFAVNNRQKAGEIINILYASMRKSGQPLYQSNSDESIDIKELINSMVK
jgi:Circadian oscillating protein COP23